MSLLSALKRSGPSGFGYGSSAEQVSEGIDLRGKTFLLTGCNSGLGLETFRVLSLRGAHVIAAARTEAKAQAAIESLSADASPVACELSEPESVRACVAAVGKLGRPLDGMICNAGIMALPKLTLKYGLDLQFLTNHIGHFILVNGLLESLAAEARVVMLSSSAHKLTRRGGIDFDNLDGQYGYRAWPNYGQSKLANLLFVRQLAKRLAGSGPTVNAIHPGVIRTQLGRHMNPVMRFGMLLGRPLFLKSIAQGAATQTYVATHPSLAGVSGQYFADCNPARPSKHGRDDALAERLWTVSEEIVAKLP